MIQDKVKKLLIVEKSSFNLVDVSPQVEGKKKAYIFEGVFAVLNEMNRNRRIYTEEQYLPQIDRLQQRISENKIVGELNYPVDRFEVDFKNASHVVEKLSYDKSTGHIMGRIRLLNTPNGDLVRNLVEDGIPINISSRAAGSVNPDGTVVMKQLFTYDIVSEPGFEQAMLNRVNEKYGYDDCDDISIYEIEDLDESKSKKSKKEPKSEEDENVTDSKNKKNKDNIYNKTNEDMDNYVTKEQFENYTMYLETNLKLSDIQKEILKELYNCSKTSF